MGRKRYLDSSINIEPFGVVIHFFSNEGNAGHEPEGINKIGKGKLARDRIAVRDFAPIRDFREGLASSLSFKLRHCYPPFQNIRFRLRLRLDSHLGQFQLKIVIAPH
jgi:hypothetical protein